MCQRAKCPACQKPTFSGCGRHVEQVLGDVPKEQRCHCRDAKQDSIKKKASVLDWLFGRAT